MSIDAPGSRRRLVAAMLPVILALAGAAGAAGPAEANRHAAFPVESLGSRGVNVVALQHLLRAGGWQLPIDGVFGPATQAAVAAAQEMHGLPRSGVVDGPTWLALTPSLESGATGAAVIAAQLLLNLKDGAELALSGAFDSRTGAAVERFQRRLGVKATGSLDAATWRSLLWHYVRPDFRSNPMCNYHSGNGRAASWGTAAAVGLLEAAVALFNQRTGLDVAVGELSLRHGGRISGHATHHLGLDVDLGLIRRDGRHCRLLGLDYRQAQYDRQMTRELIQAIYDAAPGRVKLIYFNDPVLVREGLVVRYPNHHHHLHVRYCEVGHVEARYRCSAPPLPSDEELAAELVAAAAHAPLLLRPASLGHVAALRR